MFLVQDRIEQSPLVTEVMIQSAAGHARTANHFFSRGVGVAAFAKKLARYPEQRGTGSGGIFCLAALD